MNLSFEQLALLCRPEPGEFRTDSLEDSYKFCKKIALGHYENFPVGSLLIPEKQRNHVFAIYCFARIADDISDNFPEIDVCSRIALLESFRDLLTKTNKNPVFIALNNTLEKYKIEKELPSRLITAFIIDLNFQAPETMEDLMHYCHYSANPVGEMMLRLFGFSEKTMLEYSNSICTALQLANFWQDLSIDLKNERIYIPKEFLIRFDISEIDLKNRKKTLNLKNCFDLLFSETEKLFENGEKLVGMLNPLRFKLEIALTIYGGRKILQKAKDLNFELIYSRPKLTKFDFVALLFKSIIKVFKNN